MIISSIFIGISMLLDSIISNFINYGITSPSLFTPLFIIVAIPLIYPFFCKDNSKYLKFITICGLIYDLGFTDTLVLNAFIFFALGWVVIMFNNISVNNSLSTLAIIIICLVVYNFLNYGILYVINVHNYGISYLFNIIKSTIILNILYGWLSYYILGFISNRFRIKRIN